MCFSFISFKVVFVIFRGIRMVSALSNVVSHGL